MAENWKKKYDDLLVNFKDLDKYNDVLYRCYWEARKLRNNRHDTKLIVDMAKELFTAIATVERFEDELYRHRKNELRSSQEDAGG